MRPSAFVTIAALLLGISPVFADGTTHCDSPKRYRVWLRTFGNGTQGDAASTGELKFLSYGLTLGIDRQINRNWLFGLALGENKTSIDFVQLPDKGTIDAFHADLFARRTFDRFFLDVEGNFGYNDQSFQRNVTQWGISCEAGTWWSHGLGKVEPYVRFSHIYWNGDAGDSKETLMAGVRYSWRTATDLTTTVPRFYGGVLQELGNTSLFPVSSFGNTPTVFPVGGLEVPETRLFLGGGFTTSMGTSLDILLRYTAEMSSRNTSHTALLGVNCNF